MPAKELPECRGLVVEAVYNSTACDYVDLHCSGGVVVHIALEADCCSESYFDQDSIVDMHGLLGHTLVSMQEVATGAPASGCRQEYQEVHCLKITTNKEAMSVLWRNDSNGYYDGKLTVTVVQP